MGNSLAHYGVKGMRWGVIRMRKKTGGTYTTGMRFRKNDSGDFKKRNDANNADAKSSSTRKSVKDMTDDELNAAIRRLELEKRYKDLNPEPVSAGRKFVDKVLAPAATEATKNLAKSAIDKAGKKLLGLDESQSKAVDDNFEKMKKQVEKMEVAKKYRELTSSKENAELKRLVDRLDLERKQHKYKRELDGYETSNDDDDD